MIQITTGIACEHDFLPHAGQCTNIPPRACENALTVLPACAEEGQAVGLKLDLSARNRAIHPVAEINGGQGDWHLPLGIK